MKHPIHPLRPLRAAGLLAATLLAACSEPTSGSGAGPAPAAGATERITLGAYTTPREVYSKELIPAFAAQWKRETGKGVVFEESYQASGAQARAILEGFEADVAALSLEPDIATLEKAGLVTSDWRAGPHHGMVSNSIVVLAVRPGNPKGIRDWADLARDGIEVITPNVRTSGGAMWNVAAIYGAALRGKAGVPAGDPVAAEEFLAEVLARVLVMDKGARESMVTFERGVGDVALTYENEVIAARRAGKAIDYVVPTSTILIENPAAVVDANAEKHGNAAAARAFVESLRTPEAQRAFAAHGYRPVDPSVASDLPPVSDLFTVRDLGGWDRLKAEVFAEGALYDRALARVQRRP